MNFFRSHADIKKNTADGGNNQSSGASKNIRQFSTNVYESPVKLQNALQALNKLLANKSMVELLQAKIKLSFTQSAENGGILNSAFKDSRLLILMKLNGTEALKKMLETNCYPKNNDFKKRKSENNHRDTFTVIGDKGEIKYCNVEDFEIKQDEVYDLKLDYFCKDEETEKLSQIIEHDLNDYYDGEADRKKGNDLNKVIKGPYEPKSTANNINVQEGPVQHSSLINNAFKPITTEFNISCLTDESKPQEKKLSKKLGAEDQNNNSENSENKVNRYGSFERTATLSQTRFHALGAIVNNLSISIELTKQYQDLERSTLDNDNIYQFQDLSESLTGSNFSGFSVSPKNSQQHLNEVEVEKMKNNESRKRLSSSVSKLSSALNSDSGSRMGWLGYYDRDDIDFVTPGGHSVGKCGVECWKSILIDQNGAICGMLNKIDRIKGHEFKVVQARDGELKKLSLFENYVRFVKTYFSEDEFMMI